MHAYTGISRYLILARVAIVWPSFDYEAVDPIAVVNMTAILPNNAIANSDNKVEAEPLCLVSRETFFLKFAGLTNCPSPEAGRR
jgi:hypothetical protein